MEYINDKNYISNKECVVTFGKFDGLHRGHQLLVKEAVKIGRREQLPVVLCSFDMSSWIKKELLRITTTVEKKELCDMDFSIDVLLDYPFDETIADETPEKFISTFLKGRLKAKYVVVGSDWRFGRKRSGDSELLKALSEQYDYKAVIFEKVLYHDREISSTWIREEIKTGNMELVKELLGYNYFFYGEVCHGKKLGRTIGFPTVNLLPEKNKVLPCFGVYATTVTIDGVKYKGITNIGVRPTVDNSDNVTIETFILDFNADIYGKYIKVELNSFIRNEMRFESVEALMAQLQKDILWYSV